MRHRKMPSGTYGRRGMQMDIGSLSTALAGAKTMNSVSTAVLGKQLDVTDQMGQQMVQSLNSMPGPSLEQSVNPAVGGNFDVSV